MSDGDASETPPDGDESTDDGSAPAADAAAEWESLVESGEKSDEDVDADLRERVTDADPDELASEIAALRSQVDDLESELAEREETVDDLESRLKRTQADFQNYKKRMQKRREQEQQRATEALVERLLDVRDNLVRALEQDADADIRDGIEATLRQFDEELERENVSEIAPAPGEDVDPQRHEVLLRVESDQPEGTVAEVHRPGYEMAEKVIRTAQVTVSEGDGDGE